MSKTMHQNEVPTLKTSNASDQPSELNQAELELVSGGAEAAGNAFAGGLMTVGRAYTKGK